MSLCLIFTVSIVSAVLILVLVVSEFSLYRSMEVTPELVVDSSRGQKMRINFDVVVHKISCECKQDPSWPFPLKVTEDLRLFSPFFSLFFSSFFLFLLSSRL